MAYDLDSVDLEILRRLSHDGRMPASALAEQVGLSRPAVSERMEKLERAGVIRGVTAVVDPGAVGQQITAYIFGRERGPLDQKALRALDELLRRDEIVEMHAVAGDDCYLFKVRTESIASLNSLVNELGAAPLSLSTRTTIVMETYCEKIGGVLLAGKGAV